MRCNPRSQLPTVVCADMEKFFESKSDQRPESFKNFLPDGERSNYEAAAKDYTQISKDFSKVKHDVVQQHFGAAAKRKSIKV